MTVHDAPTPEFTSRLPDDDCPPTVRSGPPPEAALTWLPPEWLLSVIEELGS